MVKKGKELDPMNNVRKAAAKGDWTSLLVEYAANKAGLGQLIAPKDTQPLDQTDQNKGLGPLKPKKISDFLNK